MLIDRYWLAACDLLAEIRAEGSNDGQSDTALTAVAPQPDDDPIVAESAP